MKKGQQQKNAYDSVFDFIFDVQKSGENKPFPKPKPSDGVYYSSLIDIGTQPAIYPLESAFNTINKYVQGETKADLGNRVSVGFGAMLRGEGNQEIKDRIAKNRAEANFARIGGQLHSGIDGALVSLYSKFNGASSKTAYEAGKLFADLKRKDMAGDSDLFGYRTRKEIASEDAMFAKRGTDLKILSLMKMNAALDKKFLDNAIKGANKYDSYRDRIHYIDTRLRMFGISDPQERRNIATNIYGDGVKDFGVYRNLGESERDKFDRVLYGGNQKTKKGIKKKERNALENDIRRALKGKTEAERRNDSYIALVKSGKYTAAEAFQKAGELAKKEIINTGRDIAKNAVTSALVTDMTKGSTDYKTVKKAKDRVDKIISKQSRGRSFGGIVEGGMLLSRWVKNGGQGDTLREGNWEDFGVKDLNFTQIVREQKVKDENGKVIGSYYTGANSVIGKLLGSAYYFHPNNLIRGLFLDGSLLLKLASKYNNNVINKRSLAYFLYRARIGKIFSVLAKPFKFITSSIVKLLNPMVEGIKRFAKNFLTKMLGTLGPMGWLVNLLIDILGDKLAEYVAQFAQAVAFALIGMFLVSLTNFGTTRIESRVEDMISPSLQEDIRAYIEEKWFTEEDFLLLEDEKTLIDLKE